MDIVSESTKPTINSNSNGMQSMQEEVTEVELVMRQVSQQNCVQCMSSSGEGIVLVVPGMCPRWSHGTHTRVVQDEQDVSIGLRPRMRVRILIIINELCSMQV